MSVSGFELQLKVRLQKVEWDPEHPEARRWTNEQISVEEQELLGPLDFAQIALVMGRFHDVAEGLKAELLGREDASRSSGAEMLERSLATFTGYTVEEIVHHHPEVAIEFITAHLA